MIMAMKRVALWFVLVGACSGEDGGARTPELLAETPDQITSVAVGDAVYLSTSDQTIWTAPKKPGTATMLVANEPGSQLAIAGDYLYWANSFSSVTGGNRHELTRLPLGGGSPQVIVADAEARSFVVDGNTVYFTSRAQTTPETAISIYSVPASGGTPAVLTTGGLIESVGDVAVDADRIYSSTNMTFNSLLLSFAKDGSDGVALTGDTAGTGGIGYMAVHGDKLYFLASTGGGSYSEMLKVVAKSGGEAVEYYQDAGVADTYCGSMQGFAIDDDYIYIACRARTKSLLRRVSVDGGPYSTLAVFPDAANRDGSAFTPAIAVMDDSYVYVGLGTRLYRVEK